MYIRNFEGNKIPPQRRKRGKSIAQTRDIRDSTNTSIRDSTNTGIRDSTNTDIRDSTNMNIRDFSLLN
jgi:hypothetical protein